QEGLNGAPPINVILGDEAHVTILTALRMLGLGARSVKRVPTDAQGRMVTAELRNVLKSCAGPTIVCAQAGNVNTGAFDPLDEIADALQNNSQQKTGRESANEKSAWLHVDGAFGL